MATAIGIGPQDYTDPLPPSNRDSGNTARIRVNRQYSYSRGDDAVRLGFYIVGGGRFVMTTLLEPDDAVILAHKLVDTANEAYRARGQAEVIVPSGED
jgi:hypothetical protein